jgi:TM2 domain-containing membrane protein YozV
MSDQENQNTDDQQNNEQGQQNQNQNQGNWNQGNQQQQGNWNQGSQQQGNWQQGNQQQGNWQQSQNSFGQSANDFRQGYNQMASGQDNKKVLAGLLGIFLGGFGVHKFILGYNTEGIILLSIFLISLPLMCVIIGMLTIYIPFIIGLIEGIIYLTKSDEEFYQTYQVRKKAWF